MILPGLSFRYLYFNSGSLSGVFRNLKLPEQAGNAIFDIGKAYSVFYTIAHTIAIVKDRQEYTFWVFF